VFIYSLRLGFVLAVPYVKYFDLLLRKGFKKSSAERVEKGLGRVLRSSAGGENLVRRAVGRGRGF